MSIKYYQLAKDEELPDEFCAVRDVGGEPSEYTFYVPEVENAKLREQADFEHFQLGEMKRAACMMLDDFVALKNRNARLATEYAKLRKYVCKALSAISSYCDCCPYVDCGCDTETVPLHEGCKAFEELSELGVEVDDGN